MGERDMNEWLVSGSGIGLDYDHYGRETEAADRKQPVWLWPLASNFGHSHREDTSVHYFPLALCVTNGIQH
jgi:hypothetical protein